MKIFGINFGKEEVIKDDNNISYETLSVGFKSTTDLPVIQETRNQEWVNFGIDNNYPTLLIDAYNSSPIHQSIISRRSKMVAGDGYEYTETNDDFVNNLINFADGSNSIKHLLNKTSFDLTLFGAYAIEVMWSLDFTKILKIKHIPVQKVRVGKKVNGEYECFYVKHNWNDKKEKPVKLAAFDVTDKTHYNQVIYYGNLNPMVEYYGLPDYISGLNWVYLDSKVGLYHKSNMENGFQPSLAIKFYKKPGSQEEKQAIVDGINQSFAGVRKTGKAMIFFSDGKDLAPDVQPIEVSNIDKQFTVISDQIVSQILTAHSVTSPELYGINVPGRLGNSDLEVSYNIYQNTIVRPSQEVIEESINKIFIANGNNINFKIKPFDPLKISSNTNE